MIGIQEETSIEETTEQQEFKSISNNYEDELLQSILQDQTDDENELVTTFSKENNGTKKYEDIDENDSFKKPNKKRKQKQKTVGELKEIFR